MDNLYKKGDVLQIKTKTCEMIEGQFHSLSKDKSRISLCNVKELPQDIPSDGVLHYYDSEIQNVVKLKISTEQTHIKITQQEYEDILKTSKKYIYVNQVDNTYHKAIEDLKYYNYVGLSTDGAYMGRKCKMPFLVISTPTQIYIFDTHVMQYHAFDGGLKEILEGEAPKKIVHDSRNLSDCLFHKHNVKLQSVFDTQVGDLIITKNKCGSLPTKVKSLNECLTSYLGLQSNIIDDKPDMVKCTERPLSSKIKDSLAKNICFLHRLSEAINDEMSLPFLRGVEYYVENIRSCDDFKAWELCGKQNQVPKEFKSAIEY